MNIKPFMLIGMLSCCGYHADAQQGSFSTINYEKVFVYGVKVIDEFFERFNDDEQSYIRQKYKEKGVAFTATRGDMIWSLFDLRNNKYTGNGEQLLFVNDIVSAKTPVTIALTDSNWYATVTGTFRYDRKPVKLQLVLRIVGNNDKGYKWMISGIRDNAIFSGDAAADDKPVLKEEIHNSRYIPTSASSSGFVTLRDVLVKGITPFDYMESELVDTRIGRSFIEKVRLGRLSFDHSDAVSFSFYQVSNWIFDVSYFSRKENNSGWLISGLYKASDEEKKVLLHKLLNR